MDLSQLKNTSDDQFNKDVTFNAEMPSDDGEATETDLMLTIKSVRNPEIKPRFSKLINDVTKETAKLNKPNVTDVQYEVVAKKIATLEVAICKLVFVKFSGLTDGDKPYPCNEKTMQDLVVNHEWIRKNIVGQASSTDAFYQV